MAVANSTAETPSAKMPANRLVLVVVVVIVITPSVVLGVSGTFPPVENNPAGAVPNLKKPRIPGFSKLGPGAPQGAISNTSEILPNVGIVHFARASKPAYRTRTMVSIKAPPPNAASAITAKITPSTSATP